MAMQLYDILPGVGLRVEHGQQQYLINGTALTVLDQAVIDAVGFRSPSEAVATLDNTHCISWEFNHY
jgi:hypothetical protein